MATEKKEPQKTVFRDDGNGQFITKEEFKKAPPNTVTKEKVPLPKPSKK